jgi:serine/threonine protein kinase
MSTSPSSFVSKLIIHHTKILGVGGFGTVYEGAWGGVKVAVKRILKSNAVTTEQEEKALKMLDHRNVIKLFHVEKDRDLKYLKNHSVFKLAFLNFPKICLVYRMFVLELCDASLDHLFLNENDPKKYRGPMPPEAEVLIQLAKGLEYIHQMGLVHRNIKPQNVLIWVNSQTKQVLMKWTDFGFSKRFEVNERGTFSMGGVRGAIDYFAPEILKLQDEASSSENETQKRGTVQSDVFAEGLVFGYFLSGGVHPFGTTSHQIQTNLRTNEPANLPSKLSQSLWSKPFGSSSFQISVNVRTKGPTNLPSSSKSIRKTIIR